MSYTPKVHLRHPRFTSITYCGRPVEESRCGEARSDTMPPAVFLPETGSVHACTCLTCVAKWQKARATAT